MTPLEKTYRVAGLCLREPRLVLKFRRRVGHWPDLLFPTSYNEKMLWRKLFDHDPTIRNLSDKLTAKAYFRKLCPDLEVLEPLWIGERAEDIPEGLLDQDVIVKTNHGSAYNIIVRDQPMDRPTLNATVNRWLGTTYGTRQREWAYADIAPKVFVEPMLRPKTGQTPFEFNFETFNGRVTTCFVMGDKAGGHPKVGIYDEAGNRIATTVRSVPDPGDYLPDDLVLPPAYLQAAAHARILGRDHANARVDFMCIDGRLYGCEMTFFSKSGYGNLFSIQRLKDLTAEAWDLRRSWFLNTPQNGWRERYRNALRTIEEERHGAG